MLAVVREGCGCSSREEAISQTVLALGVRRNDEAAGAAEVAIVALLAGGALVCGMEGGLSLAAAKLPVSTRREMVG